VPNAQHQQRRKCRLLHAIVGQHGVCIYQYFITWSLLTTPV
jgi:hypothetical protein